MTPTLPEILRGNFLCLAEPPTSETAGEFLQARVGMIAMLNLLAAQEAETGPAATLAENAAIEALFAVTGESLPADDGDGTPAGRDARNDTLRQALTALHIRVETRGDAALDARILSLYRDMATWRELTLPPLPAN